MADLAGAIAALRQLETPDSSVAVSGTVVEVEVRYRDVSQLTGGAGRGRAAFVVEVSFDEAAGEYRLRLVDQRASAQISTGGLSGSYSSTTMLSGTMRTRSFARGSHAGEQGYGQDFDSKPWQDAVVQRVEAHGWTRRKGFWGRLFS
ncbi:hypothetical protein [Microbacterium marinilacus]|uniref:DUF4429 domain-containing protein n=1 Tax=Microbacterium marinilacus TaxID=415209 RepID=A0ABP7BUI8_9MICO|nr:hypothetical protein [Microbacterium marinilacus]MBY0689067.1 hypothetical protein [Microbacterium marinilacus]